MRRSECWERLGLREGASAADLKEAFRRRAKHLHPDLNAGPEAHESFVRLVEAYRTLRDAPPPDAAPATRPAPAPRPAPPAAPPHDRRPWAAGACVMLALVVTLGASVLMPTAPQAPPPPVAVAEVAETDAGQKGVASGRSAAEPGPPPVPAALAAPEPAIVPPAANLDVRSVAPSVSPARRAAAPPRRPAPRKAAARPTSERRRWGIVRPQFRDRPRRPRVAPLEELAADDPPAVQPAAPPPPAARTLPQLPLPGLGLLHNFLGAR